MKPSQIIPLDDRIAAWDDAGRMCHYCDRPTPRPGTKGGYGTHFDHVVPVAAGGSNEKSNLVVACKRCNREKGKKSYSEFVYWKRNEYIRGVGRLTRLVERLEGQHD